jgi:hypothetical protein
VQAEFLGFAENGPNATWDAALMNPPLDGGVGVDHVARALTLVPVVVSLLRTTDLHTKGRYERFWLSRGADLDRLCFVVSKGEAFKGAQTDFVVARFNLVGPKHMRVEWWR